MSVYLLIGTILFAEWEGWNYLDSVYFCVTSLLKIGLGDLVPGVHVGSELDAAETLDELTLVINFDYILLGMGIWSMCYCTPAYSAALASWIARTSFWVMRRRFSPSYST